MPNEFLDFNGLSRYTSKIVERFKNFVPTTRKINDKPLSDDIKLTYTDVGAQASGSYATTSQLSSYVPTSRTINGKPLTDNIKLTASDIGINSVSGDYVPTSRKVNGKALSSDITIDPKDIGIINSDIKGSPGGIYAIAIGYNSNASASQTLAIGTNAFANNICSVALGWVSKAYGEYSTSIGSAAEAVKDRSVAIGYSSVCNGANTVMIGHGIVDGNDSVCIGSAVRSFRNMEIVIGTNSNAKGAGGIAIGSSVVSENAGLAIGVSSNVLAHQSAGYGPFVKVYSTANNSSAIGAYASVTEPNTIQLGGPDVSSLKCKVSVSTTSDARDKADITPIRDGAVEFLKRIQAICYRSNLRILYIPDDENQSEKDKSDLGSYGLCSYDKESYQAGTKKGERIRVGVLAQEVQEALKEVYGSEDYANLVNDNFHDLTEKPTDVENQLTITYSNFIPFLIKAIQELSDQNETLSDRVEYLESQIKHLI